MVFFLAGAVVSWKTRVQPTVALITAELEFLAASDTGCLGLFIHAVIDELLQHKCAATTVYEDTMCAEWLQIQQRPLSRCVISQFVIPRCKNGQKEIVSL
jgi:hypothetical protein